MIRFAVPALTRCMSARSVGVPWRVTTSSVPFTSSSSARASSISSLSAPASTTTRPLSRPSRRAAASWRSTGIEYSPQLTRTVWRASTTRAFDCAIDSARVEMPSETMPSTTAKVKTPTRWSPLATSRCHTVFVAAASAPGMSLRSEYARKAPSPRSGLSSGSTRVHSQPPTSTADRKKTKTATPEFLIRLRLRV